MEMVAVVKVNKTMQGQDRAQIASPTPTTCYANRQRRYFQRMTDDLDFTITTAPSLSSTSGALLLGSCVLVNNIIPRMRSLTMETSENNRVCFIISYKHCDKDTVETEAACANNIPTAAGRLSKIVERP